MPTLATTSCCPFCRRPLPPLPRVTDQRIICAGCRREIIVPARSAPAARPRRSGGFPVKTLAVVLALAGLTVGWYYYVWPRLTEPPPADNPATVQENVEEQAEPDQTTVAEEPPPVPTPEAPKSTPPSAVAAGMPTPAKPDPIAWLQAHPDRLPPEVRLTKPTVFPIFYQGRLAGSAQPPVGTTVLLMSLLPGNMVVASYDGNARHIPVDATDLEARAIAEMARPDPTPVARAGATPSATAENLTPEEKAWRARFAATGKVGSSMDAPARGGNVAPSTGSGHVSYTLEEAKDPTPEQQKIYDGIHQSMDAAIGYYNKYSNLTKKLTVAYSPGTPTADGGFSGHIRLGSQRNVRACMHEMGHTMGIGTHPNWGKLMVNGHWQGQNGNRMLQELTHKPDAEVHGDRAHFWPGGLNFDTEVHSEQDLIFHVKMVQAMVQDLNAAR